MGRGVHVDRGRGVVAYGLRYTSVMPTVSLKAHYDGRTSGSMNRSTCLRTHA